MSTEVSELSRPSRCRARDAPAVQSPPIHFELCEKRRPPAPLPSAEPDARWRSSGPTVDILGTIALSESAR